MRHLTLAFRTLFKTAVRHRHRGAFPGARDRRQRGHLLALRPDPACAPCPCPTRADSSTSAAPGPKPGSQSCNQAGDCDLVFSYPMFRDLERSQTVFTGLAAHCAFGVSLSYQNEPMTGQGMYVSGSYFPTLGLRPALGRLLGPDDDQSIGANFVTVLSLRLLGVAFRLRPGRAGPPDRRERPDDDHRRGRAARLRGHDARRPPPGIRTDQHARDCCRSASGGSRTGGAIGSICSPASSPACRWRRPAPVSTPSTGPFSRTSRRRFSKA